MGNPVPEGEDVRSVNGCVHDVRRRNMFTRAGNNEFPMVVPPPFDAGGATFLSFRVVFQGVKSQRPTLKCCFSDGKQSLINFVTPENLEDKAQEAVRRHAGKDPAYLEKNARMEELIRSYRALHRSL
eukprot:jgi/Tetstr1/433423/TSEL_022697.t1